MNDLPRQKLKELIRRFGTSLTEDAARCRGMLKDLCPEHRKEIAGLTAALEEGVAEELLRPNVLVDVVRGRLARKLEDDRGLTPEIAVWAVDTWALALNLITETQLAPLPDIAAPRPQTPPTSAPTVQILTPNNPISSPVQPPPSLISTPISAGSTPSFSSTPSHSSSTNSYPLSGIMDSYEVVTVNDQGQINHRVLQQNQCVIIDLGNGIHLELMYIPGGSFQMGSPHAEGTGSEKPQHHVNVPAFYMGKYPITQEQYYAIMKVNPSNFKGSLSLPVESVRWYDAQQFCQKLSLITSQNYRLPSEAEWEYACRAGTTTPFYFGNTLSTAIANYDGNHVFGRGSKGEYPQKTTNVGSFPPNAFGLHDMHGNVWEWCEDTWHDNYSGAPRDGRAWIGGNEELRLLRGGSWRSFPRNCRCANRSRSHAGSRCRIFGFRVVLSFLPGSFSA